MKFKIDEVSIEIPSEKQVEQRKLGGLIDRAYEVQQARLKAAREVRKLKEAEAKLDRQIRLKMLKTKLTRSSGKIANFSFADAETIIIEDKQKFLQYVHDHDAHDLVYNQVGQEAARDRIADDPKVLKKMGLGTVSKVAYSVTKKGSK